MSVIKVTELLGDGIGPELRESVYAVADALPIDFEFIPFDLSLENRESGDRDLFDKLVESMNQTKLSIKYPTVTSVSSPNAIIRRLCNFSVILRPVISIKGIESNFTEEVFLYIVRIATGGTYDDPGRMIGKDSAISIRLVERDPCRQAARFAFEFARKNGLHVTSSSKYTIQPDVSSNRAPVSSPSPLEKHIGSGSIPRAVTIRVGIHPFPFRTRKLSPPGRW